MEDEDEFEKNEYANEMYWMMRQPDIEWPMVSVNCWTASTMLTITHFQVLNTKTESNRFSHCGSMWQIRRGERIVAIIVRNPDKSDANKTNEFSSFVSFRSPKCIWFGHSFCISYYIICVSFLVMRRTFDAHTHRTLVVLGDSTPVH